MSAVVLASAAREMYASIQGQQPSYTDFLSRTTTAVQTVAGGVAFSSTLSCPAPQGTPSGATVVNYALLSSKLGEIKYPFVNGFYDTVVSSLTVGNTTTKTFLVGVPEAASLNIKLFTPTTTNVGVDILCNKCVAVSSETLAEYMSAARDYAEDFTDELWHPIEVKKVAANDIVTMVIPCGKNTVVRFRDIKRLPNGVSDEEIASAAGEAFPKNLKIQVNQYYSN